MEAILAIAIGVVASTGVWLLLRGRSFQVVVGLALLSYAVNLFIFATGRLSVDREPVLLGPLGGSLQHYDDPLPQALVLTAIVIGFAMTALLLVVTMALRGLSGNDHVDGIHAPPGPRDESPADTGANDSPNDSAEDAESADAARQGTIAMPCGDAEDADEDPPAPGGRA
ncbi:Na+/H+ antiporter subunit C [Xylophilus rhododendri]|uniref:Na+/H+ antiporter subunit C n=1 Tax=Xylophilus rhododendri TaxID=2697032 RepID=A0A857JB45_9BURK|nr:Na+/H+ antiporter subunit C [Xylophilus rhododendri]